ncbi:MAG TPA: D-aminoacylase [Candidatus Binataceae bacterium]|nr:D-aminoacylase [Candidatus Binataceae bacterium]
MSSGYDLVIRNASIVDGTGAPAFEAGLAIRGDRIARVGDIAERGATEIDARGLSIAPGFIDVHSHDDWAVFITPEMDFKVMQGVTTDIVGNCGMGAAPNPSAAVIFRALHGPAANVPDWTDYAGYFRAFDANPASINVGVLVGHGSLRLGAMGNANREPTTAEMATMRSWLNNAIDAGAVGLSTGLVYEPGRFARTEEIIELSHQMRGSGALYASHMRNEARGLLDSIRETIRIGQEAGVPVQISHHKASGEENWGKVRESLKLIDEARAAGLDVTADQYPYTSGSTVLSAVIQNGGLDRSGARGGMGSIAPERILVASVPSHPEWEGRRLDAIAAEMDLGAMEAARKIIREDPGAVVILDLMNEHDVRRVMAHPSTMIGSDGLAMGGKPHPRLYGTFPRVIGHYAREAGLMPLEEAIHRMTAMPAKKFHLTDRGVIREDAFADLVVFDAKEILDTATYADPRRYPTGISHVFVNGATVVRDGAHIGARPGRAIRRQA